MKEGNKESTKDALRSLKAVLGSINQLAPSIIAVMAALALGIIYIASLHQASMMVLAIVIVLLSALLVFHRTNSYSEGSVTLVIGLLTVFSIEWDSGKFIVFATVWAGFSLFAMAIGSIKLAAHVEDIYRQAALKIAGVEEVESTEKKLRELRAKSGCKYLGVDESAEVIRLFCFRKMPISIMEPALKMVESISIITKLDHLTVGELAADVFKALDQPSMRRYKSSMEWVYSLINKVDVSPEEFMRAYRASRSWLISNDLTFEYYFLALVDSFESGKSVNLLMEQAVKVHA